MERKNVGHYSSPSHHLSHTTEHHPFENKVWDIYIFVKKCIRSLLKSSLSVDYVSAYICVNGYTTVGRVWATALRSHPT